MVGVGWITVVGITSWGKGLAVLAGIVVGLFEFAVGDDGTAVGVGLQAMSIRIRARIIRCLFMAYL
jgi:hypothetical protein